MTLPTIHTGGTSASSLLADNKAAFTAINAAIKALSAAAPNGRDYYLTPGGTEAAVEEHRARLDKLLAVRKDLEELCRYLYREGMRRETAA